MPTLTINKAKTAVLCMDYQNDVLKGYPSAQGLAGKAAGVLSAARAARLPVIYIVVGFRDGFPEISPRNKTFSLMPSSGMFRPGSEGGHVTKEVAPQPGDIVVTKHRVGAFHQTDLDMILRAKGIETLVLFGVATAGVVLSTVRYAVDADYEVVVIDDLCADRDDEVHRVLMQKVFKRQCTVATAEEFVQALK